MPRTRSPLLHTMVERADWLHFRCLMCDRDKLISGFEACYTYGHGLTFDELRSLVKARCGKDHCEVTVGVALEEQKPKLADGRRRFSGQV